MTKTFFTNYNNVNYKLSLNLINPTSDIEIIEILNKNENIYKVGCKLFGFMQINNTSKYYSKKKHFVVSESYNDYCLKKKFVKHYQLKWIYDIVDGCQEQNKILFSTENYIFLPDIKYELTNNHYLCILKDKNIMTLRDLNGAHISLLEEIQNNCFDYIENVLKINKNKFTAFIHYLPSAWLLHIHFCNVDNYHISSGVEYSHSLQQVIINLKYDANYYINNNINIISKY